MNYEKLIQKENKPLQRNSFNKTVVMQFHALKHGKNVSKTLVRMVSKE